MRTEVVTALKENATQILSDLNRKTNPVLITTSDGKPAAYLVNIASYKKLSQRISLLEGILRGEKAIKTGKVISNAQARKRFKKWLS